MPCAQNNGTGTVKGTVFGASRPVTVFLESTDKDPIRYYDGYEMMAKQDGSFAFLEVRPGTYRISAEANGFMLAPPSNNSPIAITLRAKESRKGVRILMVPKTQVCGRVLENGIPSRTWVDAWQLNPEFGTFTRNFLPSAGSDGSYRFPDLAPGTYFLDGSTTWYPGTINFRDAKPIIVGPTSKAGAQCSDDIRLQPVSCRGTQVRGSITQVRALYGQQYQVSFREHSPAGGSVVAPIDTNQDRILKAGDSFEDTLCPGTYDVLLTDSTRMSWRNEDLTHKVVFDKQKITVGQDEVSGLVLTPHPMASIQGEVHFEDITRREICPARGGQSVAILREGDGQFQSVDLGNDNHFAFQNVEPGYYQLYIGPVLREAVFVKSLVIDGRSYSGRRFLIAKASPVKMDVTLSGDIAQAEGRVSPDRRGEPRWEVAWTRPKGSVSGKIVGAQSEGLTVELDSARYNSDGSYKYTAIPSHDGTFHFDNVDPGVYTLGTAGKGFVTSEYGALNAGERGAPIVVKRGARIKGLTLKALKLSAICGRVVNAQGTPQPQMHIFIESFRDGYPRGAGSNPDHVVTDQNGIFHADGFAPGDYFIGFPAGGHIRFFSSDGTLRPDTPLHLRAGQNAGCALAAPLELPLPAAPEAHLLSGAVIGKLSRAVGDRFWVSLIDENEKGAQEFIAISNLDAEHRFTIRNVPNGRYILKLQSGYGPEPRVWSGPFPPPTHLLAKQQIEVRGANISDIKITPVELPMVTGRVLFTNLPESWKGKSFDKTSVRIMLVPRTYRAPYPEQLSPDHTFHIGPLDASDYEVRLLYGFDKVYVRSIRLNGQPIEGRYLRLRPNQLAHLDIEVSGNGGQLNFTVLPDTSLPKPAPHVDEVCRSVPIWPLQGMRVALLPEPLFTDGSNPASSREKPILQATRVSDGNRIWLQFRNVPPGKYRAIAAERLSGVLFGNTRGITRKKEHALLAALAALGKPLTVDPNSTQEIALPDKTIDVDRLASKMGLAIDTPVLGIR